MAGVEGRDVGFRELGLGELRLQPVDDRPAVAVEHPEGEAQGPHVLGPQSLLVGQAERLDRVESELRDVEADDLPAGEAVVLERVGGVARLGEVARAELAFVGDDQPAGLQIVDVGLQRRRVHRDQHVGRVASGLDRGRAEIDLEGGDAEGRALRRADLGGEIREGGEVVARQGRRQGELAPGQLHAVAAVAGEANDDGFRGRVGGGFLGGDAVGGRGQSGFLHRGSQYPSRAGRPSQRWRRPPPLRKAIPHRS